MKLDRDKLIRAREMLGYSIETTAEEAGVSKNSVLRAEHEDDIRPVTARKIAAALRVRVADLIGESETLKVQPRLPDFNGEPRRSYPYPWMAGSLAWLLDHWEGKLDELSETDPEVGRFFRGLALDLTFAVTLKGGEEWERLSEHEKQERRLLLGRVEALGRRAFEHFKASMAAEGAEIEEEARQREMIRQLTREIA